MFIIGNLIAAGLSPEKAGLVATYIINDIPEQGISEIDFFKLFLTYLPEESKRRYVLLDLMKKYKVSNKSTTPIFMFLGGFTGKTFLTSYVQQHLGINRVIALDDEKYVVRAREPESKHLWKATYEEPDVYEKTVKSIMPRIIERIQENLHDYESHKKWTFFYEGIYFTTGMVTELQKQYPNTDFFSVLLMPPFEQIKERYIIRWMNELGRKYIENNQDKIADYIKNVENIKKVILRDTKTSNSVIIEEPYFDDCLEQFYANLSEAMEKIAKREKIDHWVKEIVERPEKLSEYESFLDN